MVSALFHRFFKEKEKQKLITSIGYIHICVTMAAHGTKPVHISFCIVKQFFPFFIMYYRVFSTNETISFPFQLYESIFSPFPIYRKNFYELLQSFKQLFPWYI